MRVRRRRNAAKAHRINGRESSLASHGGVLFIEDNVYFQLTYRTSHVAAEVFELYHG
jgi:hypothetical protein